MQTTLTGPRERIRGFVRAHARRFVFRVFIYVLLAGLAYLILYPLFVKLISIFMSEEDLLDKTVSLFPRHPTLAHLQTILRFDGYLTGMFNTAWISLVCALSQTFICTLIGYGFGKFRFKGQGFMFALVIFTMLVPAQIVSTSLYFKFRSFDIPNLFALVTAEGREQFMSGQGLLHLLFGSGIPMLDTIFPLLFLSLTGLGFKNSLYIFLMRQFFRGTPEVLSEAARVDGAGQGRIFLQIHMPLAGPMMVSVFLLSFAWLWTDSYYSNLFFPDMNVLSNVVRRIFTEIGTGNPLLSSTKLAGVNMNAAVFFIIVPMLILYIVLQRRFIQGIERSGITG